MEKDPAPETETDTSHIIKRPDGFYWQDTLTRREYGPFASMEEAIEDREFSTENELSDDETLREAEDSLGISDWIDPDTGELAEDTITRLDD